MILELLTLTNLVIIVLLIGGHKPRDLPYNTQRPTKPGQPVPDKLPKKVPETHRYMVEYLTDKDCYRERVTIARDSDQAIEMANDFHDKKAILNIYEVD